MKADSFEMGVFSRANLEVCARLDALRTQPRLELLIDAIPGSGVAALAQHVDRTVSDRLRSVSDDVRALADSIVASAEAYLGTEGESASDLSASTYRVVP